MTTPLPTPLPPRITTVALAPTFAAMAGRALGFIDGQLDGLVVPTGGRAWVRPDSDWPSEYTGPVSGSFALAGTSDATTPCPITMADPNVTSLPPTWRGHAWGALAIPARAGLQVVAYRQAGTAYNQAGTATPDPSTGYWNIDLTAVPTWQGGSWCFALLDTSAGNAQVGEMWPSAPAYADIAVEHFVITDARYPAGQVTATTTGRFALPASQPGVKGYRLARRSTGEILADCTPATGAVRSYLVAPGEPGYGSAFVNQCYAYDQALCLFAAIAAGRKDIADRLAGGLLLLQTSGGASDGGFIFSGQQQAPQFGDPAYRTGAHAVCTDALIAYIEAYCTSDFLSDGSAAPWSRTATLTAAAHRALAYLATMLSDGGTTAGLYLGGTGVYDSANGGAFDPGLDLTWASTEHNLDVFHCLSRAGRVLGDPAYAAAAEALASAIHSQLWNAAAGRFHQGMRDTGPDTADPLDCHTWAAIFCTRDRPRRPRPGDHRARCARPVPLRAARRRRVRAGPPG